MTGFNLITEKKLSIPNCSIVNDISFVSASVLSENLKDSEKIFINKCFAELGFKEFIEIGKIRYPVTSAEKVRIQKISEKYFKRPIESFSILQKYKNLGESKVSLKEKTLIKQDLDLISKEKSLFSKLVQIKIYMKLELYGKVNSIINSILKVDPVSRFFNEEYLITHNQIFVDHTIDILSELKEVYINEKQITSLIAYLTINMDERSRKKFRKEFSLPNRLSYVQKHSKSFRNAAAYPFAWSFWLEKFSSETELLKFLDKGFVHKLLKSEPLLLSNYFSTFPVSSEKRKKLLNAFIILEKSDDIAYNELALRIQANENFSNYIKKKLSKSRKPLFVREKSFYSKLRDSKTAIIYSIYKLFKLGEYSRESLIYLYASRI